MRAANARTVVPLLVLLLAGTACQDSAPPVADDPKPPSPSTASAGPGELPTVSPPPRPDGLAAGRSKPVADPLYPEYGNPAVDVLRYGLRLAWVPRTRVLTGTATLDIRMAKSADGVELDLGDPLKVDQVRLDGEPVAARHPGADLVVSTGRLPKGELLRLVIDYHGRPGPVVAPTSRTDLASVGFTVEPDGSVWTMQEPYGAFTWYPVNDHPSDKALYDFAITVPDGWDGIANGLLVGRIDDGPTTTYRWRARDPIASYLTTIGIGRYTYESDTGPGGLPLSYWVQPGDEFFLDAARQTPELLAWLEERLGPYPFETLGVMGVDSESGMETQTLVTISPQVGPEVLLHEYAHQWYGNAVTPRTWDDLWLNEAFAFYLQLVWAAEEQGARLGSITRRLRQEDQQLRDQYGPPGDYDPEQFASSNVYYSGALMLFELRERLGARVFDRLLRQWPQEHRYGSADRESYEAWVEKKTGEEISRFMERWLTSPTTPR